MWWYLKYVDEEHLNLFFTPQPSLTMIKLWIFAKNGSADTMNHSSQNAANWIKREIKAEFNGLRNCEQEESIANNTNTWLFRNEKYEYKTQFSWISDLAKRVIRAAVEDLRCRARLKLPCWIIFPFFSFHPVFCFVFISTKINLWKFIHIRATREHTFMLNPVGKGGCTHMTSCLGLEKIQSRKLKIIHVVKNPMTSYVNSPKGNELQFLFVQSLSLPCRYFLCGENIKFRKW